ATTEESCRLGNFLEGVNAVGRLRRAIDGDQHAGTQLTRSGRPSCAFGTGRSLSRRNLLHRIGFLLALLLQETVNQMPACVQGRLQRAERRSFTAELLVTTLLQSGQVLQARVQIFLSLRVELLRCLLKCLVEKFRSEFSFFYKLGTLLLCLVAFDLILIADVTRLLVIEQAVLGLLDYRHQLDRDVELDSKETERRSARFGIALVNLRIERVPEFVDQPAAERESIFQSAKAAL